VIAILRKGKECPDSYPAGVGKEETDKEFKEKLPKIHGGGHPRSVKEPGIGRVRRGSRGENWGRKKKKFDFLVKFAIMVLASG
jgi:hypothetical protein